LKLSPRNCRQVAKGRRSSIHADINDTKKEEG
jgi:hypothetical protein